MILELLYVWTIFSALLELVSLKGTISFRKAFRKRNAEKLANYSPFVSVIIPFKGSDHKIEENLHAIIVQDYKKKEFIFVYDNKKDSSYNLLLKFKGKATILEKKHFAGCSSKVASQLTALKRAKGEVFVFADADILPTKYWLKEIVRPLQIENIAVTTGFRTYFPLNNSIISYLRNAWDSIGFGMMFSPRKFVWGGSFAMRKEIFYKLKIDKLWITAISDDTVVTEESRSAGMEIYFVPKSIVASFDDSNLAELFEWTTRQTFFVRHFDPRTWFIGILAFGYFNLVWVSGVISLLVFGIFGRIDYLFIGIILIALQIIDVTVKTRNSKIIFDAVPELEKFGQLSFPKRAFAQWLSIPLSFYNLIVNTKKNRINWRGVTYELKGRKLKIIK